MEIMHNCFWDDKKFDLPVNVKNEMCRKKLDVYTTLQMMGNTLNGIKTGGGGGGSLPMDWNVLDVTKPLQEQFVDTGIYAVCDDIDLLGETINIPNDSVIVFWGGSFANGTLIGNGSSFDGLLTYSILNDTVVEGFDLDYFDLRWFGAMEGEDCADAFDRCIACYNRNILTPIKVVGHYKLTRTVNCLHGLVIWNDANSRFDPQAFRIPEGGKIRTVGEIEVAPNVTAFFVDHHSNQVSKDYAMEALVSIKGMRFICKDVVDEFGADTISDPTVISEKSESIFWNEASAPSNSATEEEGDDVVEDDIKDEEEEIVKDVVPERTNRYSTCVLNYYGGGMPSAGFKFVDSEFRGFDKAIYFSGPVGKNGSTATAILFDNCDFKYNNYAIYAKNKSEKNKRMSFNGLKIDRCDFKFGSKILIDGAYGANQITNSTFERNITKNPMIEVYIWYGLFTMDKLYLEKNKSSIKFEGFYDEGSGTDYSWNSLAAAVELGEMNDLMMSYEAKTSAALQWFTPIYLTNVSLVKYPALLTSSRLFLNKVAINRECLTASNYTPIRTTELDGFKGTVNENNTASSVVVKTLDYNIAGRYDLTAKDQTVITRGYFPIETTYKYLDAAGRIPLQSLSAGMDYDLPWKSAAALNMTNDAEMLTFYKGCGTLIMTFLNKTDDGETEIEKITTPYTEGICMIKLKLASGGSSINTLRVRIGAHRLTTSMFISTVKVNYIGTKIYPLERYLSLLEVDTAYRTFGTTAQRPKPVYNGFVYYDTTLGRSIVWDKTNETWKNMDGSRILKGKTIEGNPSIYTVSSRSETDTFIADNALGVADRGVHVYNTMTGAIMLWNGSYFENPDGSDEREVYYISRKFGSTSESALRTLFNSTHKYVIAATVDLSSLSTPLVLGTGADVTFVGGGKFINGSVQIKRNYVYGDLNKAFSEITADSIFATGQAKYDVALKKMVLWNGSAWVNVDGSALDTPSAQSDEETA